MPIGRLAALVAALALTSPATGSPADDEAEGGPSWVGVEATRTRITIANVDGSSPRVILDSPRRFAAPEWTPDGSALIVNGGGKLWRLPIEGGEPALIPIRPATWIGMNHALSPDGRTLAYNAYPIWTVPVEGGRPTRVTPGPGNNLHAWSPDGKRLAYSSNRGKGLDLFSIGLDGRDERPLTTGAGADDAPQYSADGRWIYFLSDRAGGRDVWRIPAAGAGPGDAKAERITSDDREDASPRPSPDGKWLLYASYPARTRPNMLDRDVLIRRIPLPGATKAGASRPAVQDLARIVGGHDSMGARPFSPDGRRFAYASYEPPPPSIRLILFTPSDLSPPANVPRRLTQIADATERFLASEMARHDYPPAVSKLFRRNPDGTVEVTHVKGDRPSSDPIYKKAECDAEARRKARQQLKIEGDGHIWFTFLYVGERPTRFDNWMGGGGARDGGGAIVNYESIAGEVRPDLGLNVDFNATIFLKGTIHELGHAFGLPHIGPDLGLNMGNSLMGPNNAAYADRKYSHADQVYLTEASAAMLWKHPIFSGSTRDRQRQPTVQLADLKPTYSRAANRITLAGRLVSDMTAHSVVVLDDLGKPEDEYWYRSHAARLEPDGTFRLAIDRPARANGQLRILFCFDNGAVTGDGLGLTYADRGEIRKRYRFREGSYTFSN